MRRKAVIKSGEIETENFPKKQIKAAKTSQKQRYVCQKRSKKAESGIILPKRGRLTIEKI
jgi:hypothetical protein